MNRIGVTVNIYKRYTNTRKEACNSLNGGKKNLKHFSVLCVHKISLRHIIKSLPPLFLPVAEQQQKLVCVFTIVRLKKIYILFILHESVEKEGEKINKHFSSFYTLFGIYTQFLCVRRKIALHSVKNKYT